MRIAIATVESVHVWSTYASMRHSVACRYRVVYVASDLARLLLLGSYVDDSTQFEFDSLLTKPAGVVLLVPTYVRMHLNARAWVVFFEMTMSTVFLKRYTRFVLRL